MGEPLAAPFARVGDGEWDTNLVNAELSSITNLSVQFSAYNGNHPLQQVDLFVDGTYYCTLTNPVPCPGNLLTVILNGYPITYTVPTNSTLSTITTGLAALINTDTNATQVKALSHGDRIELQSIAGYSTLAPFYVADNTPKIRRASPTASIICLIQPRRRCCPVVLAQAGPSRWRRGLPAHCLM